MTGEPGPGRVHIVVVEDSPADVELLRLALENAEVECELTVIDDGGEALAFVQQRGKYARSPIPDLLLLDLNLPKYNGLEILSAMRGNQAFADLPVAVLSSSSWAREREKLEVFRIGRYITKPPELDNFLRIGVIVKELLLESRSRETPPGT